MRIAFTRAEKLAAQPTLFLHGNLASSKWWELALAEWRKAGSQGPHDLIFADWRGCGQNPQWPKDKNFTLEDLAQDGLELLESLKLENVALVGHSLGGLIALQMMILAPGLFSKAVLLDPVGVKGVVFDDSMYEAFRQMALSEQLTATVILSTVAGSESLPESFKKDIIKDAFHAVQGIGTSVLEILKTVDLRSQVARLKIPTLILHGRGDAIIPVGDSEATAKLMPTSQLEIVECGHCWNVERPAGFVRRIRDWLKA